MTNDTTRVGKGISGGPLREIKAIQSLLKDVYSDPGTIVRELIQNADDAGAARVEFVVLSQGIPDATNSLLHGPALLVANDGPFSSADAVALHQAIGGSKEDDASKIGTFGLGLKSVFHICEAFAYIGAKESNRIEGVLNPWSGTGGVSDEDPIHPDWNILDSHDSERLARTASELLDGLQDGLLLWLPLRRVEHLDRGDRLNGLKTDCVTASDWLLRFNQQRQAESLVLLLAQCGHLRRIAATKADSSGMIRHRETLACVSRREDTKWVGRYKADVPRETRPFTGTVYANELQWRVTGAEAVGSERIQQQRRRPDWPTVEVWRYGKSHLEPQKGLAHAAITILRPITAQEGSLGLRLRWAAYLPLADEPDPTQSAIIGRIAERVGDAPAWQMILHGYFWPSQDRKSIPGVTKVIDDGEADPSDRRPSWNMAMRDELVLPLLPSVLERVVAKEDQNAASSLLSHVAASQFVHGHKPAVCRHHWLLPQATADGVTWVCRSPSQGKGVLSIPRWTKAPEAIRRALAATWHGVSDDFLVIDEDSPRLATCEAMPWPIRTLDRLLHGVLEDVFQSAQPLNWVADVICHVLADGADTDGRAALVADWLGTVIGKGGLRAATAGAAREDLHEAWRKLCEALPPSWLVPIPAEALTGVSALAAEGVFGSGLFPYLFPKAKEAQSSPDPSRLDRALHAVGKQLSSEVLSGNAKHTRLRLAEALFAVRCSDRPLGNLESLPLIRATRLPSSEEVPLSMSELRHQIGLGRAFAGDAEHPGQPAGRAVSNLAAALGKDVWFVSRKPAGIELPSPTSAELAKVVIRAPAFAPPEQRDALLRQLVDTLRRLLGDEVEQYEERHVRTAVRALLVGRSAAESSDLTIFFAESSDERRTLDILLPHSRGSGAQVPKELTPLVRRWEQDVTVDLSITRADAGAIHDLLGAVGNTTNWAELKDDDALHLLQHLHVSTDDGWQRWYALPLHRRSDGTRAVVVDGQTYRAVADTGLPPIPTALESRLTILAAPEREIEHLYGSIPELTKNEVLRLILEDDAPQRFAGDIVNRLRRDGADVELPDDHGLRGALRRCRWLPLEGGDGTAPDDLIIAPSEVLSVLSTLGEAGALSGRKLPVDIDSDFWRQGEAVVREIHGRLSRFRQLERVHEALDQQEVVQIGDGAYAIANQAVAIDADFVTDARKTALAEEHKGWKLIATFDDVLRGVGDAHQTTMLLVAVAKKLYGQVSSSKQVAMLQAIIRERPAKDSPGGRTFARLLRAFAAEDEFSKDVLPRIELPTQDGNWHPASDVARSASGVARQHLVLADLREPLGLDEARPIPFGTAVHDQRPSVAGTDALRKYFEPWRNRVRSSAVGSFLALLGPGLNPRRGAERLAREWLGEAIPVEAQRYRLVGSESGDDNPAATISVHVSPSVADGESVSGVNVLGDTVQMVAADSETLFAVDPISRPPTPFSNLSPDREWWDVKLRDVGPTQRSEKELLDLLGSTVDQWAVNQLGADLQQVRKWSSEWRSSATDIGPARAAILATLPHIMSTLDVSDCPALQLAVAQAERAQYNQHQMRSEEARVREKKALDELAKQVEAPDHQQFLWHRVQQRMRSNGYDEASVLLELTQNADDALAQAAEIKAGGLPPHSCRLVIDVHRQGNTQTIDVTHYGRPINETGGSAFPTGKERQWDRDLYFMMLMNLSGKPGESVGQSAAYSTTGRFGLGFKSVHLLSACPSVVSGFMSFSIAGGLLPREEPKEDVPEIEGQRGTRMRLPLLQDSALLQRAFERFNYARPLLTVFAREIREVIVRGGPTPGNHSFNGRPIGGAPGWSIGATTAMPTEDGQWRILRFKPSEAGEPNTGTLALAVGIRDGKPKRFTREMPFLWNVVPTGEDWGCGYAINGPFKLDPGRAHVSLDDDATLRAATALGDSLAHGLVQLHDAGGAPDVADNFVASLWHVLSAGLDTGDPKRGRFLRELHGGGRGLSGWIRTRSVVPTGLQAPFQAKLPKLTPDVHVEVAQDFDYRWCKVFRDMARHDEGAAGLFRNRHVVCSEVAMLLQPMLEERSTELPNLRPHHLVAELAQEWDHRLTPERLHALRPIGREGLFWHDDRGSWRRQLVARSATGEWTPLRQLLLPGDMHESLVRASGEDVAEELLRSAFAPDCWRIDESYIRTDDDLKVFQWLRARHGADSAAMSKWIEGLSGNRQPAALRYLVHGLLGPVVLKNVLDLPQRPAWLVDYDRIAALVQDLAKAPWERNRLLISLFPDRFETQSREAELQSRDDGASAAAFFRRLADWWADDGTRKEVLDQHEEDSWPSWARESGLGDGLRRKSPDHWLALFVLGACQSLGRTQDVQHRGFLELAHEKGWWDVFVAPTTGSDREWMEVLRSWQDAAVDHLEYRLWLSVFPTIYQLSRHLDAYRRLMITAERRSEHLYSAQRLLAPRSDSALSGAGSHFDAPPLPLGIGYHWCLRELVRLGVLDGEHLYLDCYVPAKRVLGLLERLGLVVDEEVDAAAKSQAIYHFLQEDGRPEAVKAHLQRAFDIPLRHLADAERRKEIEWYDKHFSADQIISAP